MRLIQWEKKGKLEGWHTYSWQQQHWLSENRYTLSGQAHLYQFLIHQKQSFTWALIGINIAYRNTFYALMPKVHVIILPQYLVDYMLNFSKLPNGYDEEIAISVDEALREDQEEVNRFLESFYKTKTVEEARKIYDEWQLRRSLHNVIADKLQIVMQLFDEEIFNYFLYSSILTEKGMI